jgi:hypothetical protein
MGYVPQTARLHRRFLSGMATLGWKCSQASVHVRHIIVTKKEID